LGESFHGIPLFLPPVAAPPPTLATPALAPPPCAAGTGATAVTGRGVGSLLGAWPIEVRSGGRIVRAVSRGAGSRPADFGKGLISLPQPRQNL